jgi:hypothetical protein
MAERIKDLIAFFLIGAMAIWLVGHLALHLF